MSKFLILNGVRRALASLESGRKTVPALVFREGKKPELHPRMRIDRLFAPRTAVKR